MNLRCTINIDAKDNCKTHKKSSKYNFELCLQTLSDLTPGFRTQLQSSKKPTVHCLEIPQNEQSRTEVDHQTCTTCAAIPQCAIIGRAGESPLSNYLMSNWCAIIRRACKRCTICGKAVRLSRIPRVFRPLNASSVVLYLCAYQPACRLKGLLQTAVISRPRRSLSVQLAPD